MSIHALPPTTVRTLGASQVLNDSVAIVKELLDNSLDARATSISIEISSNTLDSIQVRDNGHGIPAQDRTLVAKPHCTSKINGEDDLRVIGGSSLGFRGEALASIAEMSGSLTITTRVASEQVATALKINQRGEVDGQEGASLPIGTTVKATDFMKSNPVRKQMALKNAEKTLARIKHMLQSYVFARPTVRVSLRVLKAKNDGGNWVHAPKAGANAEDVTLKIAGTRCASQCVWSVLEDHGFTLQAFLPRIDADASKVSNLGCFFSVDFRPVSASRGTARQIAKVFRESLKKANSSFEGVKDPFIYLNISCPPASYDANVEPAKDDVVFEDPDIVLKTAKRLFDTVYPAKDVRSADVATSAESAVPHGASKVAAVDPLSPATKAAPDQLSKDIEFDLLDNKAEDDSRPSGLPSPLDEVEYTASASQGAERAFRSNMYGCDEEDLDLMDARPPTGRTDADLEELRQARRDVNLSNPWVIAKLNAPLKGRTPAQDDNHAVAMQVRGSEVSNRSSAAISRPVIDLDAPGLPTPRPSSPSPLRSSFHPFNHVPDTRIARDGRLIGSQALPPPEMQIAPRSPQPTAFEGDFSEQQLRRAPIYDYTLSSQAPEHSDGLSLRDIPNAPTRRRYAADRQQAGFDNNPPFRSPLGDQKQAGRAYRVSKRAGRKPLRPPRDTAGLVVQGELGDLQDLPRPLTPPMRNRDMRDFVTSLDLTADESAASLVESRNCPQMRRARSVDNVVGRDTQNNEENLHPSAIMLGGRGFIPASELAALEAHIRPIDNNGPRTVKRRKTGEDCALREINPNVADARRLGDDERQPKIGERAASRRRSTTGGNRMQRIKSAHLPLERTPVGHAVQNIVLPVSISGRAIAQLAGKIDEECSIARWDQPATDVYAGFAVAPTATTLQNLTIKLHRLLVHRVSVGEMMQDLQSLVRSAFDARDEASSEIVCE
jgi:DNA mismatch repair protein MutL